MKYRIFLAAALSIPCLAAVGCGGSPAAVANAEPKVEPLTPAQVAAVQEEMEHAASEERAYQQQHPVGGKKAGRRP